MTSASVEVIQPADRRRGIAALNLAFASDQWTRWVWPDACQYATYMPRAAEAYGGRAFDHGTAHVLENFAAVALWLPPGTGSDEGTFTEVIAQSCDDQILRDLHAVTGQMARFHPPGDLWFLPMIGVDPAAQGRGLGSALLRHGLAACDRDGLPAYLEATNPRNRALYERHGFRVIGVIQAGSAPPLWAMLREPRSGDPGPALFVSPEVGYPPDAVEHVVDHNDGHETLLADAAPADFPGDIAADTVVAGGGPG